VSAAGFIKLMRDAEVVPELLRDMPAMHLLTVVAYRARRTNGFHCDGLEPGEALVGDYAQYGMTRQQYRSALKRLEKWEFATFRPTTMGTIAKLADSRIYDINGDDTNQQTNQRPTNDQPTANH